MMGPSAIVMTVDFSCLKRTATDREKAKLARRDAISATGKVRGQKHENASARAQWQRHATENGCDKSRITAHD
jgi:hypothetical protein